MSFNLPLTPPLTSKIFTRETNRRQVMPIKQRTHIDRCRLYSVRLTSPSYVVFVVHSLNMPVTVLVTPPRPATHLHASKLSQDVHPHLRATKTEPRTLPPFLHLKNPPKQNRLDARAPPTPSPYHYHPIERDHYAPILTGFGVFVFPLKSVPRTEDYPCQPTPRER